jgi:hypothetical protein
MVQMPWLVRCPRCSRRAAIVSPARLCCAACGLARDGRADLREGSHRPHQALHHKLPAWMKSAKHRDEVLAALRSLRARLNAESD